MDIFHKILESYPEEGFSKIDGFDSAIIGIDSNGCLVYSIDKVVELVMLINEMEYDDACNYFYYTILSNFVGKNKPTFITLIN